MIWCGNRSEVNYRIATIHCAGDLTDIAQICLDIARLSGLFWRTRICWSDTVSVYYFMAMIEQFSNSELPETSAAAGDKNPHVLRPFDQFNVNNRAFGSIAALWDVCDCWTN